MISLRDRVTSVCSTSCANTAFTAASFGATFGFLGFLIVRMMDAVFFRWGM